MFVNNEYLLFPLTESHKFEKPQRAVLVAQDVKKWELSEAYQVMEVVVKS